MRVAAGSLGKPATSSSVTMFRDDHEKNTVVDSILNRCSSDCDELSRFHLELKMKHITRERGARSPGVRGIKVEENVELHYVRSVFSFSL